MGIKIMLSSRFGEKRITQAELSRMTGIRPNTINELYHELTDRVNLNHVYLICEALGCELDELMKIVPEDESVILHTHDVVVMLS